MHTETFSYLPQMTDAEIAGQIQYILDSGWIPGIEYTNEPGPENSYWNFWKLPLYKAKTTGDVLSELNDCKMEHPGAFCKITGYDNIRQGQVLSFVAYRPAGKF